MILAQSVKVTKNRYTYLGVFAHFHSSFRAGNGLRMEKYRSFLLLWSISCKGNVPLSFQICPIIPGQIRLDSKTGPCSKSFLSTSYVVHLIWWAWNRCVIQLMLLWVQFTVDKRGSQKFYSVSSSTVWLHLNSTRNQQTFCYVHGRKVHVRNNYSVLTVWIL